jgi:hypothetical protein
MQAGPAWRMCFGDVKGALSPFLLNRDPKQRMA